MTSHVLSDVQSVASYSVAIQNFGIDPLVALPLTSTLNQFTPIAEIPTEPNQLGPPSPVNFVVSFYCLWCPVKGGLQQLVSCIQFRISLLSIKVVSLLDVLLIALVVSRGLIFNVVS